jgi:ATP-dependent Clp protease ATP-binding subunit ClpA
VQIEIARLHIARELEFLREKGFELSIHESVVSFIIHRGFHSRLGARPLRDTIERLFRGSVADVLLLGNRTPSGRLAIAGGKLVVADADVK